LERAGPLLWPEGEQLLLKLRLGEVTPASASGNPEETRGSSKYHEQLRLAEVTPADCCEQPASQRLGEVLADFWPHLKKDP